MTEIDDVLGDLLRSTGASRVTLRQDVPGDVFPVTHEALAPGVHSLRDERRVDMKTQPVAIEVAAGRQVVQHDSAQAYDDPPFHEMRALYGGLAAQIVTPVVIDGRVVGIVSLHQLGSPRQWSDSEIEACNEAVRRVGALL